MSSPFPRALSDGERGLLDLLLAAEFPGVGALRAQRESVRVKGLWQNLGGIVMLEVCDADAPKADVVHTVPVRQAGAARQHRAGGLRRPGAARTPGGRNG